MHECRLEKYTQQKLLEFMVDKEQFQQQLLR